MTGSGTDSDTRSILVVDDHPIVRQGLAALLASTNDLRVNAQAEDFRSALAAVDADLPDALVIDLSLTTGGDGLLLIETLRSRGVKAPILVYSMHDEKIYAERVLQAGGSGYLMKSESPSDLIQALRRLLDGGIWVSPAMSVRLIQVAVRSSSADQRDPLDRLSNRELSVYRAIGRGLKVREIAELLTISAKTVESHQRRIREKLNLDSSRELLRHAVRWAD